LLKKKEGDKCADTTECLNQFGCYNTTCTQWGVKKVGDDVGTNMTDLVGTGYNREFCEFGEVDQNNKCSMTNYTDVTVTKVDSKGFVPCDFSDKCSYTDGNKAWDVQCQCGYNDKGQGYCPVATAYKQTEFRARHKTVTSMYKNACHTLNKFRCPAEAGDKLEGQLVVDGHKTVSAHLYYNAVSCAYDVLSSSYINFSVAMLAFVFAFIF